MNNFALHSDFFASPLLRTLVILVSLCAAVMPASAKRSTPKPVTPVTVGAVEYSAPDTAMGFVVATDTTSRKELWRVRIYSVNYDKELEKDVQDVFITSLAVNGGALIVTNERKESYSLDLATRKVTQRK